MNEIESIITFLFTGFGLFLLRLAIKNPTYDFYLGMFSTAMLYVVISWLTDILPITYYTGFNWLTFFEILLLYTAFSLILIKRNGDSP